MGETKTTVRTIGFTYDAPEDDEGEEDE